MSFRGHVLVTGASGFIAKHIVSRLLEAGYRVRGTVRSAAKGEEVLRAVRPALSQPGDLCARLSLAEADLTRSEGWDEAMEGIDMLVHTASPYPRKEPCHQGDVVAPALQGTLRVLGAAHRAGIRRAVMTSAAVAVTGKDLQPPRTVYDERDWSDPSQSCVPAYVRAKTLAERAAWCFTELEGQGLELTTICPGFVVGAPLDHHLSTSLKIVGRILRGKDRILPQAGVSLVDVRDIAAMHVRALEVPEAAGQRFIGGDRFFRFTDIARILKQAHPERRIMTHAAPNAVVKLLAAFDRSLRGHVPGLGRQDQLSCDRARTVLGMQFADPRDALRATAAYLLRHGLV
ncbi:MULTISPECIES: aldehyde reductase [Rhodomicrobium]|uniref:SDR family oxidoreductase n=1 Tax=Rhodomicrobium TaxID=1068 RepID=UPI000B4BAD84|nr:MULTISPECIES: aldehyde reductase [Rhodomicrobium]